MIPEYPMRRASPFLRQWAHGWINHWSLWCMASATPDLRLPPQPQGITASWLVPNYTAWWQRHVCANNLPKVVTWKWNSRELNPEPSSRKSNALTITPPGHTHSRHDMTWFVLEESVSINLARHLSSSGVMAVTSEGWCWPRFIIHDQMDDRSSE